MPETTKPETAGVIAPPPVIFLSGLGIGLIVDYLVSPFPITEGNWRWLPAALLVSAGAILMALSFRRFRKADTALRPWKPATALVTTGVYGISRNPIYVGMALVYAGLGFGFNTVWVFVLLALVLPIMHIGVIKREERYLQTLFGEDYRDYLMSTPRWL